GGSCNRGARPSFARCARRSEGKGRGKYRLANADAGARRYPSPALPKGGRVLHRVRSLPGHRPTPPPLWGRLGGGSAQVTRPWTPVRIPVDAGARSHYTAPTWRLELPPISFHRPILWGVKASLTG